MDEISQIFNIIIIPLVCTIFLEIIVALLFKFRGKALLAVFFVNLLTNPILNAFFAVTLFDLPALIILIIFEIVIFISEFLILNKAINFEKDRSIRNKILILSFVMNLVSFLATFIIR